MQDPTSAVESDKPSLFRTTCWTDVLSAAQKDSRGEAAFSRLYQDYWIPVYRYVLRKGHAPTQAEDITQEFFVALLTKDRLAQISREGGRFRSFLLTAMRHFLTNLWDQQTAAKRGAGATVWSLDESDLGEPIEWASERSSAEAIYDREWAMLVLQRATQALEQEYAAPHNKQALFAALRDKMQGDRTGRPYAELASELQLSEGSLRVAVHRMRGRFGEILRGEIARTVHSEAEVQDEIRYLLRIVSQ
ncbi:MAG: sigma-70 family RNA polymerase sigma factor [Verrucomicrobiae bacterium]|nr:sigma-70 family RNA polymerase sigma factor [Verrucomicrobiae bacterium]